MSVNEKMTAIADAIRAKTGGTEPLGLDAMAAAIPDVHAAGVQSEYDRFWDAYQQNGGRTYCYAQFAGFGWTDETYNPKYPIVATGNPAYLFWQSRITDTKVDVTIGGAAYAISNVFSQNPNLKTIRKLIIAEGTSADYTNIFTGSTALENITVVGTMTGSVNMSGCNNLTHDSLMSIIGALKDYAGTGTTKTLTIGATNLNKLTADEKKIATDKGWTLA